MPTDACVYFYECEKCKSTLKPLKGIVAFIAAVESVKCRPIQAGDKCC